MTPAAAHTPVEDDRGSAVTTAAAAVLAGAVGAAVGAGAMATKKLGEMESDKEQS
jgi:hypothetical protein